MPNNARAVVMDILPKQMADEIWSAQYEKVLPITFNIFEISAILPAVFYMFRFGQRRGQGEFLKTFAPNSGSIKEQKKAATVEQVAEKLASNPDFDGFDGPVEKAILGDLLLCFCLENSKHALGRDKQIQRVAPTHYMASWIDLPENGAHLRFVPEMIVAMLANQKGCHVDPSNPKDRLRFPVGRNPEENMLLRAFSFGIQRDGRVEDLNGDKFDEQCTDIDIDQLLMIRLGMGLGKAPDKIYGKDSARISNQRPIAEKSARHFSDDIRRFVRSYAPIIPRHAFVGLLESCIATGMTTILTSVVQILLEWDETGSVTELGSQRPAAIFVDCSSGVNNKLRGLAEQSLDDLMRGVERIPEILMMMRLLDYAAKGNSQIKKHVPTRPYAEQWLNLLGDLLYERHEEASYIHRQMSEHGQRLADGLAADYPAAEAALRNAQSQPNPIRRLATALTPLMGTNVRQHTISMVDSTLNIGRPNGLAQKRRATRGGQADGSSRRQRDVRSLVLTDSVLDYLVHLHLLASGNKGIQTLSLKGFLDVIRKRYGFHIDTAPTHMTVSNEILQSNRKILERRLRDLGLFVGVNDAEAMKRLQTRFLFEEAR